MNKKEDSNILKNKYSCPQCRNNLFLVSDLEIIDNSNTTEIKFSSNNEKIILHSKEYYKWKKSLICSQKFLIIYKKSISSYFVLFLFFLIIIFLGIVALTYLQNIQTDNYYLFNTKLNKDKVIFIFKTMLLMPTLPCIFFLKRFLDEKNDFSDYIESIKKYNDTIKKIESHLYSLLYCKQCDSLFYSNSLSLKPLKHNVIDRFLQESLIIPNKPFIFWQNKNS